LMMGGIVKHLQMLQMNHQNS